MNQTNIDFFCTSAIIIHPKRNTLEIVRYKEKRMNAKEVIALLREWREWEEKSKEADGSLQEWVNNATNDEVYEAFKGCDRGLREFLGQKLMFKISDQRHLELMRSDPTHGDSRVTVLFSGGV